MICFAEKQSLSLCRMHIETDWAHTCRRIVRLDLGFGRSWVTVSDPLFGAEEQPKKASLYCNCNRVIAFATVYAGLGNINSWAASDKAGLVPLNL